MIYFLMTQEHGYTLRDVCEHSKSSKTEVVYYERLLEHVNVGADMPPGTYVFTDFDRLTISDLLTVSKVYRGLKGHPESCRVLNDPARVKSRYGLLRFLYQSGINSFNVYRADEGVLPERYPVFLRYVTEHGEPLSDLLADRDELDRELFRAISSGAPESSILIVEYCAEPVAEGIYRRLATYKIGSEIFPASMVQEDRWCVKYGKKGISRDEDFQYELDFVRGDGYREQLSKVFEIANIDYGRLDFALVKGRIEVYEINTNPLFKLPKKQVTPVRDEALKIEWDNYMVALRKLEGWD